MHYGTTILALLTREGIVIGADSLSHGDYGHTISFAKLQSLGNHTVVACEGLGLLENIHTGDITYRADEWVKKHLPAELGAFALADLIERIHPFRQLISTDTSITLKDRQLERGHLAEFLIASASENWITLLRVRIEMKLKEWKLAFLPTIEFDGIPPTDRFKFHTSGRAAQINHAFSRDGDAYKNMVLWTEGAFQRFIEGAEVSLDERRTIVRCAILLEAKANPEAVGPPFVIATLEPGKFVSMTSYAQ